jgi:hypothetical protein
VIERRKSVMGFSSPSVLSPRSRADSVTSRHSDETDDGGGDAHDNDGDNGGVDGHGGGHTRRYGNKRPQTAHRHGNGPTSSVNHGPITSV